MFEQMCPTSHTKKVSFLYSLNHFLITYCNIFYIKNKSMTIFNKTDQQMVYNLELTKDSGHKTEGEVRGKGCKEPRGGV